MKDKPLIINPFLLEHSISVVTHVSGNKSGDEENGTFIFKKPYNTDREQVTKIFRSKELEDLTFSLSPRGAKLLFYIIFHLRGLSDTIEIPQTKFTELTGLKKDSFNLARLELTQKGVIRKKSGSKSMYWVNPSYIFSGNRPKFVDKNYGQEFIKIASFSSSGAAKKSTFSLP